MYYYNNATLTSQGDNMTEQSTSICVPRQHTQAFAEYLKASGQFTNLFDNAQQARNFLNNFLMSAYGETKLASRFIIYYPQSKVVKTFNICR